MADLEWQTCDSEDEWRASEQVTPTITPPQPEARRQAAWVIGHWRLCAGVLLILVIGGGWAWYTAQQGVAQIETELHDSVEKGLGRGVAVAHDELEAKIPTEIHTEIHEAIAAGDVIRGLQIRDLGEDWALVDLQLQPTKDGPLYRQTRVYQLRNRKWVRAIGSVEEWGTMRQLESRYFSFRYHSVDHQAVTQATARLDALYAALYATFFSREPASEKLEVVLDPAWVAGKALSPRSPQTALIVLSPAATFAPAELPPDDLLAQSLMLVLFDKLDGDAEREYNLSPQWLPLRNGLRLWLIWEQQLPLAVWREPLVQLAFRDLSGAAGPAPAFAHDLCVNQMWMSLPDVGGVPVQCMLSATAEEKIVAWRYRYPLLGLALPSLADVQLRSEATNMNLMKGLPESAASGVAWATVLEYATTNFGAGKLPVFLAAIPVHEGWESLIPAVFGLPLAELRVAGTPF